VYPQSSWCSLYYFKHCATWNRTCRVKFEDLIAARGWRFQDWSAQLVLQFSEAEKVVRCFFWRYRFHPEWVTAGSWHLIKFILILVYSLCRICWRYMFVWISIGKIRSHGCVTNIMWVRYIRNNTRYLCYMDLCHCRCACMAGPKKLKLFRKNLNCFDMLAVYVRVNFNWWDQKSWLCEIHVMWVWSIYTTTQDICVKWIFAMSGALAWQVRKILMKLQLFCFERGDRFGDIFFLSPPPSLLCLVLFFFFFLFLSYYFPLL